MTDLGDIEGGGDVSVAWDINSAGQVVGYSYVPGACHAFLWQEGESMHDLNDWLMPDSSEWTLFNARAINESGQIAGCGQNPDGQVHAFLATPIAANSP